MKDFSSAYNLAPQSKIPLQKCRGNYLQPNRILFHRVKVHLRLVSYEIRAIIKYMEKEYKSRARKRKVTLTQEWKDKIQASQIMNRLLNHLNGEVELTPAQVSSAKILLGKIIPDLKSTDMTVTGSNGGPVENKLTIEFIGKNG